ncbi:MAG: DUF4215 domain-containing protein, partial [Kofleriaceae bacterium]|nr:DUF4215 domain-containing protein [Kofleriaceae bacterium]
DPTGDEDVFKFTNPGTTYAIVTFDTWNTAPGYGIGVSCGTSIDTGITLRNAAGTSQASNNDRVSTDRCSSVTYNLPPGGIIYAHVVENGDNAIVARYALKVAYAPVVCGDMMVGPGEQCDDGNTMPGDGCDAMCVIEPTCGNSMLESAEQCDDGNTLNGDNCSSTCQLENAVTESEPNEDGTPQTGGTTTFGNDFSIVNANGPFTTTTRIAARISPVGDEDVFKITNPGTTTAIVTLNTYNLAPAYGFGVSCGTSIDTAVHLRDAAGVSLASNDDRSSSPSDWCSALTYNLAPGASVYAHVIERGDDAAIASYALVIDIAPVVCGDGTIGPGETCDDGNTVNGDGCSATCHLEGAVIEMEPNEDGTPSTGGSTTTGNDFSSANANGPFSSSTTITASLIPTGDEDVFAFTNPDTAYATLILDVWNLAQGFGIGVSCASSIDTAMHVRNATGTSLALNDNRSATDKCSALTYVLAPGQTVYVHISENGDNAQIASYALVATVVPTICGDGQIGPGEQCDDGNTTPGDGCSATCQVPQEIEPNDTTAQAMSSPLQLTGDALIGGAIATLADKDFYQVTVAAPTVVRFESFTAPNDCAAATTINLRLLDSTGTLIVEDTGSGLRSCGAIVMPLAAGTYFIQVEEQGNNATIASYMLEVAFQDDVGTETEPNETVATASVNLFGENDSFVFGDHMLATDADVYAIVVPSGRSLRAEVIEGDRATETCEGNGIDSKMTLLDENGATVTSDDDDGRGFCSKLDGTGPAPDDTSARNTTPNDKMFYIRVEKSGSASTNGGVFVYRLQVTIR